MQVQLTQEAKIASDLILIGAIFAVVGFVSALSQAPGDVFSPGARFFYAAKLAVKPFASSPDRTML